MKGACEFWLDQLVTGAVIIELRAGRSYLTCYDATINAVAAAGITDGQTFTLDNNGSGVFGTPLIMEFDKNAAITGGHHAVDISTAVTDVQVAAAIVAAINGLGSHLTASTPLPSLPQVVKVRSDGFPYRAVQARNDNVTATGFSVTTGNHDLFLGRGYRLASSRNMLIVIFPYGTPADVVASATDSLRLLHAGGVDIQVEVRATP